MSFYRVIIFGLLLCAALAAKAPADETTDKLLEPLKRFQKALDDNSKKTQKTINQKTAQIKKKDGLQLEGVASGTHGGGDVAIVNGEAYRVGEEVDGYKILEIQTNYIQAQNLKTNEKKTIWVSGKVSVEEKEAAGLEDEINPDTVLLPRKWDQQLIAFFVKSGLISGWAEKRAVLDLRRLENAADLMVLEKKVLPKDLAELVKNQYLPSDFFADQFFFHFRLNGPGVSADPQASYGGLMHFFVSEDGVVHFEKSVPASEASAVWEQTH